MKGRLLSVTALACVFLAVLLLAVNADGNAGYIVLLLLAFMAISTILAVRAAFNKIRGIASDAKTFITGDIQHARLLEVSEPKGIFFTKVNFVLELEGQNGSKHQFDRDVPTPFFAAWAYRLGKRFKLPYLRRFEPTEMLALEFRREGMNLSVSRPAAKNAAPEISA